MNPPFPPVADAIKQGEYDMVLVTYQLSDSIAHRFTVCAVGASKRRKECPMYRLSAWIHRLQS